ncbi:MAG: hypothetical protein KatS3mg068_0219 [Candidatus Sericytochromatia bacterium]|nr:MAG: hypothetical protein KatS3mg068_0219 [Candidatus Sericytochromatia bacterium]
MKLKEKNIKIGDNVLIHKAGEIIPEVVNVLEDLRDGNEIDFKYPEDCPICKSKLISEIRYNSIMP